MWSSLRSSQKANRRYPQPGALRKAYWRGPSAAQQDHWPNSILDRSNYLQTPSVLALSSPPHRRIKDANGVAQGQTRFHNFLNELQGKPHSLATWRAEYSTALSRMRPYRWLWRSKSSGFPWCDLVVLSISGGEPDRAQGWRNVRREIQGFPPSRPGCRAQG